MKRKKPRPDHPWCIANSRHWAEWKAKRAGQGDLAEMITEMITDSRGLSENQCTKRDTDPLEPASDGA